ncbi:NB-ARC domain-containing protein [Abeliophyllum distichum]|uniref:NB-ARC domain-containing protein n=1 Tax=Abeliophyllum distichum TaxID=126358 RepID=A0ABD1QIJ7_9LAMI
MATIYSEFLLQKFVNEFQETEKVCPDLSLLTNFKEICNVLQNKKFSRQHLIDMKDDLHEINDALVERVGLAEDRRGKGKALSIRSGKELWRFYKIRHRLCAIRDKLQKMEAVEGEVMTSQVLVIKKENLLEKKNSEDHGLDDQMVKIENLLCQNVGNKAIGIVGMCGSGKSAPNLGLLGSVNLTKAKHPHTLK